MDEHGVPEDMVSRIPRTMRYVSDTLLLVDAAKFYDNSMHDSPFMKIAPLTNGVLEIQCDLLPQWAKGMAAKFDSSA